MTFKTIRIKKRGGGTRLQRVKVLASGKYKFVKNVGAKLKRRKRARSRSNPVKRRVRRTAKKKRRRSRSMTIPVAVVLPIAGTALDAYEKSKAWGWEGALPYYIASYTGYNYVNNTFETNDLKRGLFPLIIGALVHKFIGGAPLNINKVLARAGVPFIRL